MDDAPRAELIPNTLRYYWTSRGAATPQSWQLPFMVRRAGVLVGLQELMAKDFAVTSTVETGSWLGAAHQGDGHRHGDAGGRAAVRLRPPQGQRADSGAFIDNPRSLRVSEKLGYASDGTAVLQRRPGERAVEQRLALDPDAVHPVELGRAGPRPAAVPGVFRDLTGRIRGPQVPHRSWATGALDTLMPWRHRSNDPSPGRRSGRPMPAPALFLASGFTQYAGAALAVGLFAVIPAASVAWWRLAVSAVVLLAWRRPWRQRWTRRRTGRSGPVRHCAGHDERCRSTSRSSTCPLGTAVAIEFLGPVDRGRRDRPWLAGTDRHPLAAAGVVLLAGVQLEGGLTADVVIGLVAILASAASWAGYILLGRRIAVQRDGISSLAIGMTAGALVYSPLAIGAVVPIVTDPGRLAAVIGIAVLSSVIPYAIEQVVLRRVSAARFAILLALLPVTAA